MRLTYRRITPSKRNIATYLSIERSVKSRTMGVAENEDEAGQEIRDSMAYFILADRKTVGIVSYQEHGQAPDPDSFVYINEVAVRPAFQGRGIGGKAVKKILAMVTDAVRVELLTHPHNRPALLTYLRNGFVITGWIADAYGDGEPRVKMVRFARTT